MRSEWAVGALRRFLELTVTYVPSGPGFIGSVSNRGSSEELGAQAHVVEQILDRIPGFAGWRDGRPKPDKLWAGLREQTARGMAALERADELAANLGSDAPEMNAGPLHPWAWETGAVFWARGFPHQAVLQAALRINAETQAKLGVVQPGEAKLFQMAFSLDDPKADAPRLRLAPRDTSDTWKNLHQGAWALGEALYLGVRNVGMHNLPPPDGEEQVALEQLGAFSLLARWVDRATVKRP